MGLGMMKQALFNLLMAVKTKFDLNHFTLVKNISGLSQ
jgi:hypothetical protein